MALTKAKYSMIDGPIVNIKDFGAVGDGSTDDKAAIQAAIDSMSNGQTLLIPSSSSFYKIDATQLSEAILVNKEIKIIIDGELRGTTFTNQSNPPYTIYVTADNVIIEGSGKLSGDGTIVQTTVDNITDPGFIRIDGDNVVIDGLTFERFPQIAVYSNQANYVTVKNCTFYGNAVDTSGGLQYFSVRFEDSGRGCRVENNNFKSYDATHHHINVIAFLGGTHEDAIITGNYCEGALDQYMYCNLVRSIVSGNHITSGPYSVNGQGIKLNGGNDNVITNNDISVTDSGIQLLNIYNTVVDGNKIGNLIRGYGIYLYDNASSSDHAMDNIVISNNMISGNVSGSPSDLYGAIAIAPTVNSSNILITGNTIHDVGFSSINSFAIEVQGSASVTVDGVLVKDNIIYGSLNRSAVYLRYTTNSEISGNRITVTGSSGTSPLRPINVRDCSNIKVNGNYIDNQVFATENMDTGIYFQTTTTGIVSNNIVIGWDETGYPWGLSSLTNYGNQISVSSTLSGVFTMDAAATKVISNTNISSSNLTNGSIYIQLTPLNSSAAALMGSAKNLYVSAASVATSFTVATSDSSSAAGTEVFAYSIIQ